MAQDQPPRIQSPLELPPYTDDAPSRESIDASTGPLVLEFGSNGCGYCRRAAPLIAAAFAQHPALRHIRVQDGPGRRLGRSFRIKLWPTLVVLRDGQEVARVVRPIDAEAIRAALQAPDPAT